MDLLNDLGSIKWTLVEQLSALGTGADMTTVEEQHVRLKDKGNKFTISKPNGFHCYNSEHKSQNRQAKEVIHPHLNLVQNYVSTACAIHKFPPDSHWTIISELCCELEQVLYLSLTHWYPKT